VVLFFLFRGSLFVCATVFGADVFGADAHVRLPSRATERAATTSGADCSLTEVCTMDLGFLK